ncbi:MAG TPA: cellulase family glycosylhydrolase [Acidimicrobiales bacterium]|nr:cellulase family glycosylhydrolase [Acidimicrobiales bacterium]
MRKVLALFGLAAVMTPIIALGSTRSGWAEDDASTAPLGFMHAVYSTPGGGQIIDNAGNPFTFRGVNVQGSLNAPAYMWGGPLSPETPMYQNLASVVGPATVDAFRQEVYGNWITRQDMARIAQLGFNSVRVPIEARDITDYTGALETLDKMVKWGAEYHLYIIPSPTELPGCVPDEFPFSDWQPGTPLLWDPTCNLGAVIDFWKMLASRYRDSHWIAGYDLANEPMTEVANRDFLPVVMKEIIQGIRQVDPNHMMMAEGDFFATDFGPYAYGTAGQVENTVGVQQVLPPIDSNMAYMFHSYNLSGNQVNAQNNITGFTKIEEAQGVPFFNGEFGANTNAWVQGTRQVIEDPANKMHGWMFWTWKDVYKSGTTHYVEEITASPTWQKVITWAGGTDEFGVADPTSAPTPQEVIQGMNDFIGEMKLANTHENSDLLAALGMSSTTSPSPPPPTTAVNCSASAGASCTFVPDGTAVQGYIAVTAPGTTITVTDLTDPTQPSTSGSDPGVVLISYKTGDTYQLTVGAGSGTVYAGSLY